MTPSVLVAFATKSGSTHEVAETVAATLRERGLPVEVRPAAAVEEARGYAGVVLGGALYMGRWHSDARRFLRRHRAALAEVPVAVFAMGPQTLEEKQVSGARGQLERALAKVPEVKPISTAIFGGVVDPAKLRFPFNRMPACDARDWSAIRSWSEGVAREIETTELVPPAAQVLAGETIDRAAERDDVQLPVAVLAE